MRIEKQQENINLDVKERVKDRQANTNDTEKEAKQLQEDEKFAQLNQIIRNNKDKEGSLITVLHQAQQIYGYLPREVQIHVAKGLDIPFPEVYGVVSFYSLFTMKTRGKYTIEVCMGTACYVKGAEEILKRLKKELNVEPGEVTEDGKFTIETTRCKGACSLAPVLSIGDDVHSNVKADEILEILKGYD